jgi:hypothetical protein
MKRPLLVAIFAGIVVTVLCLLAPQRPRVAARTIRPAQPVDSEISSTAQPGSATENPDTPHGTTPTSGPTDTANAQHLHAPLASAIESPSGPEVASGLPPLTVLENMRSAFHQYQARFGGNPVGTNPEITKALNGGNQQSVVFLDPEAGLRINDKGELIDNWGTPFFFHQLSRTVMEIRSAGPDRKMWTADDLVIQ